MKSVRSLLTLRPDCTTFFHDLFDIKLNKEMPSNKSKAEDLLARQEKEAIRRFEKQLIDD